MDLREKVLTQGQKAKRAAQDLAVCRTEVKDRALLKMAQAILEGQEEILRANRIDMENAQKNGLKKSMLDRLLLTPERLQGIADGICQIAQLKDPVGASEYVTRRPNGLDIVKVRVPLGVIGIIYEARPNVTADAAALCLKSGNAVLLRGGSEALESNRVICRCIADAAESCGVPQGAIQLIDSADRQGSLYLMQMPEFVDVLIPRGGLGLKKSVQQHATVPYIMTGMGNCHIYVDAWADLDKAERILLNAKVQRPSVCNAVETVLVHEKAAAEFLPRMVRSLTAAGVVLRGCERARQYCPEMEPASLADWEEEYNDLILAVKVVSSLDEAVEHINRYGTQHSEAIITENYTQSRRFMLNVDAAAVYTNASTRFTDGGEFGFGAEMGISTQKLHARGPMGLSELTTFKYMIYGDGQIR